MGETSPTTLVQLWRQCKHCGPIITLISWGLRTHPRHSLGSFTPMVADGRQNSPEIPTTNGGHPCGISLIYPLSRSASSIIACPLEFMRSRWRKAAKERPYQLAKDGACVSGWTTRAKSLCKTHRVHNIALFSNTKTKNILKLKSVFPLPSFYFNL